MKSFLSRVVPLGRLSRKIGIRSGVIVEMALREGNSPEHARLVQLNLPDFPGPFYLRAGTSDVGTFLKTIVYPEYDIRSFPSFQKIDVLYQNARAEGRRPLIIDCGANIGMSSIWFSRLFPEAQILAVEPAVDNIEIAKRNLRAYPNVTLLQGAVWDRPTRLKISDTTVAPDAYQVVEVQEGAENLDKTLKAFTITKLMDMADTHQPLIVKIDIEGAEAILFRSHTEWVGLTDLITIELHDWMLPKQRTSAPFIRSIANLDYDLLQQGETLFVFLDRPGVKS
jgi:FkbM family methyltransferase